MSERTTIGSLDAIGGAPAMGEIADRTEACAECEMLFLLTAPEQLYYRERGYREPGRCPVCRAARRAERNAPLLTAHQAQEAGAGPEPVYGGPGSGDRRGARTLLHPAVCAACAKETQVPFLPRGDRPVYCRECFGQRRGRR